MTTRERVLRRTFVAGNNADLCRFFIGITTQLRKDGHLRPAPDAQRDEVLRFLVVAPTPAETRAIETALRTKAPAQVPASRCELDSPKKRTRKAAKKRRRR